MPGFLETTLHQGYAHIAPYTDPYVEKARINVPLVDRAIKKADEFLRP